MDKANRKGRRAAATGLLAALLLGLLAGPLQAREGFYFGIGPVGQSAGDDLERSSTFADPAGVGEARIGALESGNGLAIGGGYGLSEFVALDLLISITNHDASFTDGTGTVLRQDAQLTSVLAGVKLIAPLGEAVELFARGGLGGYELSYESANFRSSDGAPIDDVRLSGRGLAVGAGLELILDPWGLELGFTHHTAELDAVDSVNFPDSLEPSLSLTIDTVSLLFVYHF